MEKLNIRRAALSGAVIATLCLFPLLNALSSDPVWLHWKARDSLETAGAWAALSSIIGLTLLVSTSTQKRLLADIVCSLWLLIGAFFVSAGLVKIDSLRDYLDSHRQVGGWIVVSASIALACFASGLLIFPGRGTLTRIQRAPQLMWPLILLLGFHLVRAPSLASHQSEALSSSVAASQPLSAAAMPVLDLGPTAPRTVILLFDELSPDYVYGSRQVRLPALRALAEMQSGSEIHYGAHLSGGATLLAIPVLFGPTPSAPRGLVRSLMDAGRSVRVWGWYHDYCAHLAAGATTCHANSIYNARTLHDGFSLIDPLWTNLNLLPAAFPFKVLKTFPAVTLQRSVLDASEKWLAQQLADASADVIYAHINVPHLPLVTTHTDQLSVPDAFIMSPDGYVSQFNAVNDVLSEVLASRTRPTQLIVLSDHNARPLFPKSEHEHVVFMRWRPWIPGGNAVTVREDAAELIARMSLRPDGE